MTEHTEDFVFPEPRRLRMMQNIGKTAHFMTKQGIHTGRINDVADSSRGPLYEIEYCDDILHIDDYSVVEIEDDSSNEGVLA